MSTGIQSGLCLLDSWLIFTVLLCKFNFPTPACLVLHNDKHLGVNPCRCCEMEIGKVSWLGKPWQYITLSPLKCHSLVYCLYMFVSAWVCIVSTHVYLQKYVGHILVINIHLGNIASGESFRTVILQRGKWGGCSERAPVSHKQGLDSKIYMLCIFCIIIYQKC